METIKIRLDLDGEEKVTRGVGKAGDALEDFGDDLNKAGKEATFLDKRLGELQGGLKDLFAEFSKSGDKGVLKNLKDAQRELGELERLKKKFLKPPNPNPDPVDTGFISRMVESFSKAISSGGTPFIAAITSAVAGAAPFIGAVIASAVVGTSGLAGIAGGVAMAARDPRVQDAARTLGATFMSEFAVATEPFTAATVNALQQLENATIEIAGKLAPEFEGLAAHVEPLADAFGGLVTEMLPGFKKALQAALPVLGALEKALPELGDDLSDMFESFAENPEAAAAAMHDLLMIIGETAKAVGVLTHFLSSYYEVLIRVGAVTTGWANNMPDWVRAITPLSAVADYFDQAEGAMRDAANAAPQLKNNLGEVGESAKDAATKVRGLSDAIDDFISKQLGVDEAQVRWLKGLRDLNEELTDGKRTLGLYTEEGLENREAMLQMIGQAENFRQKMFEQTGSLDAANAAYQANIQALYDMGLQAKFSRTELDALFAPYKNGPRIAVLEFQFPGLTAGLAKAKELKALYGSSAAAANAGGNYFNKYEPTGSYVSGRASGGPVMAGSTYVVGEDGPEVLQMGSTNGYIHNAGATRAMMSGASGGSSMALRPVLNMTFVPSGNAAWDALMQALWPYLLKQVRLDGGDLTAFGATA